MVDTGLADKVVLVTGCNNPFGIGAATARAFSVEKSRVYLHYFRWRGAGDLASISEEQATPGMSFYFAQQVRSADEIVREIRNQGGRAVCGEVDLTDASMIGWLFDEAEKELGPVDVLVNNAAYGIPDTFIPESELNADSRAVDGLPMSTITSESHDRHFAVNSRAVALMMAEYARRYLKRGAKSGRIINVSTDGASGFSTEVSYGASKHALESYSRAAAHELGGYGITVNVVSLGPIQTGWISPEMEKGIAKGTPLGRVGQPADVADVIVFLASEKARWLTGQLVYVGGGWRMSL